MTMMSDIITKIMKATPIEVSLKVINQMAFIDLLYVLGFREDKAWSEDEDEMLAKLVKHAEETTAYQIKAIEEWKANGCPVERKIDLFQLHKGQRLKAINDIVNVFGAPLFIKDECYTVLNVDDEYVTLDHIMYSNEYGDFDIDYINKNFVIDENCSELGN